jgi:hypothetical protein
VADPGRDSASPPDADAPRGLHRPALDFLLLAFAAAAAATRLDGWPRWALLWPAVAWGLLAVAFHTNRPGVLGKRPDGGRSLIAALFWTPYLVYPRLVRLWKRLVGMDPVPWHEVAPGVWLGRRPTRGERGPAAAVAVDLAAEVATPPARLAPARYVSLPSLNKLPPPVREIERLVVELAEHPGPIFVFCSAGKGRSATFAAALLLARGVCADPAAAERRLAAIRPGVRLHGRQRALLARFSRSSLTGSSAPLPAPRPTAAAES